MNIKRTLKHTAKRRNRQKERHTNEKKIFTKYKNYKKKTFEINQLVKKEARDTTEKDKCQPRNTHAGEKDNKENVFKSRHETNFRGDLPDEPH